MTKTERVHPRRPAAIGIHAVVAYTVAHRTPEISLRLALGATPGRVVGQVMVESLGVIGLGALIGWTLAVVVDLHLMPGGAIDLTVFLGVPAILLLVAALACWIPARRAANVDPMLALKDV
jgi:putative ABC transport system permease protein